MKVNAQILVIQNSVLWLCLFIGLFCSESRVHLIDEFIKDTIINDNPVKLLTMKILDLVTGHAFFPEFCVKGIKESVVLEFLVNELFQFVFLELSRLRALKHLISLNY